MFQMPAETSAGMPAEMLAKSPPQFKVPPAIPKSKCIRPRCAAKNETSLPVSSMSEDDQARAVVSPRSAAKDALLSEGNLTVLYQLHHRVRSLEGEQGRLECTLDSKDVMIQNLRDEMKQKDKKRADDVSTHRCSTENA